MSFIACCAADCHKRGTTVAFERTWCAGHNPEMASAQRDAAHARIAELEANLNATVLLLGDALEREERLRELLREVLNGATADPSDYDAIDFVDMERRIRAALTPEATR